jgi:hypothetical protein
MLDIAVKERKRAAWEFEFGIFLLATVRLVSKISATFSASDHYENILNFDKNNNKRSWLHSPTGESNQSFFWFHSSLDVPQDLCSVRWRVLLPLHTWAEAQYTISGTICDVFGLYFPELFSAHSFRASCLDIRIGVIPLYTEGDPSVSHAICLLHDINCICEGTVIHTGPCIRVVAD